MRRCPTEYQKKRPPLNACPRLGKLIVSADVAFGSKAEVKAFNIDVRFTPESGHDPDIVRCPLCARSRHRANDSITSIAPAKHLTACRPNC
jgi:hypothetical protein